jgi:hypothetical protein
MMHSSIERGKWVFFQNCHLAPSWMPALERLIEHINPDKVCHAGHHIPTGSCSAKGLISHPLRTKEIIPRSIQLRAQSKCPVADIYTMPHLD